MLKKYIESSKAEVLEIQSTEVKDSKIEYVSSRIRLKFAGDCWSNSENIFF